MSRHQADRSRLNAWRRYVQSATEGPRSAPHAAEGQPPSGRTGRGHIEALREWLALRSLRQHASAGTDPRLTSRAWRDLRLIPPAAALWAGAAWPVVGASLGLDGGGVWAWALGVGVVLLVAAGCLSRDSAPPPVRAGAQGQRSRPGRPARSKNPGLRRKLAIAALVTAASADAGFLAGAARLAADTAGPAGALLAEGGTAVATLEILSEPRPQTAASQFVTGARYITDARLLGGIRDGQRFTASARVILAGGAYLRGLAAGTRIETAAKVAPRGPGTAYVTARSSPRTVVPPGQGAAWRAAARDALRTRASWLPSDAAGLVPALAVGDRSSLDPRLVESLRVAGLTHLTAVSGANFAIVVGTVVLALRSLRLPRIAVHAVCCVVLGCFVGVVGPEPSVLRAGAMGVVSLVALASGRAGAGSAALSAAVIAILLADPALALSFGFALSVLATLGITLLARPLAARLSARLPSWLAAAVAVPLAAQLLCGPIVVLLDPSFQTWSLAANLAAAPLVPAITVAATVALAIGLISPALALGATAIAGLPAQLLAITAHGFAALPGARLPWAEGAVGATAMALVSVATTAFVWALGHRR